MNNKIHTRVRRSRRAREHIKKLGCEKGTARLTIHRSAQHIYAQVIAPTGGKVLAQASTLEKAFRESSNSEGTKTDLAKSVGKLIAQRANQAGVKAVAADRSGFRFHGRVAALIQSANENGLKV